MSGSHDSSDGIASEVQEGNLREAPNVEQAPPVNEPAPPPGSLSFFREGSYKFPKALLVGGGFDILANPMCSGLQPFILSESILDLDTSIEGVLLFMLQKSLENGGKKWPELLKSFAWFPKVLFDIGQTKRTARWLWIESQEPDDHADFAEAPRHSFWLAGYSNDKAKDDRMIESNGYKTLNYKEFRGIIRSVASEVKINNLGPIEIGGLSRRHWNALKEPTIVDLKSGKEKKEG